MEGCERNLGKAGKVLGAWATERMTKQAYQALIVTPLLRDLDGCESVNPMYQEATIEQ